MSFWPFTRLWPKGNLEESREGEESQDDHIEGLAYSAAESRVPLLNPEPASSSQTKINIVHNIIRVSSARRNSDLSNTDISDTELGLTPKSAVAVEEQAMQRASKKRFFLISMTCLLLMVSALLFVLYPRDAAFAIDSFDINPNNSTFKDGDRLVTNWNALVAINNENFYPINIRELKITAFLDHDRRVPIGWGDGNDLRFPARSRSHGIVAFRMPVYAPSTGLPSLIGECMTRDKITLFLKANVDLTWTHWTGHKLPMEFYATIDCKIPAASNVLEENISLD